MHILRTRIKHDIVCEFLPPIKPSNKVLILCEGMPTYPSKRDLMVNFAGEGFWVFLPRYRGTWESDGGFLKISPHQDILDVIDQLSDGFSDIWSGEIKKIENPEVYLIGSSFGGPAVILASKHNMVKKVVTLSPVIDWTKESKIEPLDWLSKFVREAFGNGYRFDQDDWNKLKTGIFYNPVNEVDSISPNKILIIQAKADKKIDFEATKKFVQQIRCESVFLDSDEHFSLSRLMDQNILEIVKKFVLI